MLLDDAKHLAQFDTNDVRASIEALPAQVSSAWSEARKIKVPASHREYDQIIVAGMGGSTLGAHLIQSVYRASLGKPFSFINEYTLPGSVGKNSLVILSSYSGTTEEVLSVLKEAKARKAKIMGIASGGPLAQALTKEGVPAYIFTPKENPSGQPRMGLGYMVGGLLGLLAGAKALTIPDSEMEALPVVLEDAIAQWGVVIPMQGNQAKLLAQRLANTIPVFVAAEHLVGNAHIIQNQIQESAKQFAAYFPLPELNHHLMEGLTFPKELREFLTFVFVDSRMYSPRLVRRFEVTKAVVGKQGYNFHSFQPVADTPLAQAFETLVFGSYVSYYLAMLARVNPSNIPWVDIFKKEMAAPG